MSKATHDTHRTQSEKDKGADRHHLKDTGKPAHKSEASVDEGIEMTFPASDPPALGGITKLKEKPRSEKDKRSHPHHK